MQSALYKHLTKVYELMYELSTINDQEEVIFEGNFKDVFSVSGASTSYYTPIRKLLTSPVLDPCITIVQQGNVSQPTIMVLHHPPPEDWEKISLKDLTGPREAATLGAELERRIESLEGWRESIGEVSLSEVLVNFERRISRLESKRG